LVFILLLFRDSFLEKDVWKNHHHQQQNVSMISKLVAKTPHKFHHKSFLGEKDGF
jgi:hypothetical protein